MNASIHQFAAIAESITIPVMNEQVIAATDMAIKCVADSHAVSCLELAAAAIAKQVDAPELDNRARVQLSQAAHAGSRDEAVALAYQAGLKASQAIVMQVMMAVAMQLQGE